MSRRRLERGFWNGRQVSITDKEHKRIYVQRMERGGRYYWRFSIKISLDWPYPDEFELDHRLPRKTLKAIWKQFNGHPTRQPLTNEPVVIHNGRKPR